MDEVFISITLKKFATKVTRHYRNTPDCHFYLKLKISIDVKNK